MAAIVTDASGITSGLKSISDAFAGSAENAIKGDLYRHQRDKLVAEIANEEWETRRLNSNWNALQNTIAAGPGGTVQDLFQPTLTSTGEIALGDSGEMVGWKVAADPASGGGFGDQLSRVLTSTGVQGFGQTELGQQRAQNAVLAGKTLDLIYGQGGSGEGMSISAKDAAEYGDEWREDLRTALRQHYAAQGYPNVNIPDEMLDQLEPLYAAEISKRKSAYGGASQFVYGLEGLGAKPNAGGFLGWGAGNDAFITDPYGQGGDDGREAELIDLFNQFTGATGEPVGGQTVTGQDGTPVMVAPRMVTATHVGPDGFLYSQDEAGNAIRLYPGDQAGDAANGGVVWILSSNYEWEPQYG